MNFLERLASGPPILTDGGTGTERIRTGWDAGRVHRAFADAGAEVIVADSITAAGLAATDPAAGAAAMTAAVTLARASRGAAPFVAASLGPAGPAVRDAGHRREIYAVLASAAKAAGADVLFAETLLALTDADAAVAAAREQSLPIAVTFAFHSDGNGYGGLTFLEAMSWTRDRRPDAAGFNCGEGPISVGQLVRAWVAQQPGVPFVVRPAAGTPPLLPEAFGPFARFIAGLGARMMGGCCGTTPAHIAAMAAALHALRRGDG